MFQKSGLICAVYQNVEQAQESGSPIVSVGEMTGILRWLPVIHNYGKLEASCCIEQFDPLHKRGSVFQKIGMPVNEREILLKPQISSIIFKNILSPPMF